MDDIVKWQHLSGNAGTIRWPIFVGMMVQLSS